MLDKKQLSVLKSIGQEAAVLGLKAWAVGGFARDKYLRKNTQDIDICFEGDYVPLLNFCIKKYDAQVKRFNTFGTARVSLKNGLKLDFVRCRKEVYPQPAALPVVKPSNLKDDLHRRDFTCNAAALSILPTEFFKLYDYYGAHQSIKGRYIEILHPQSFMDDPTRIYRALRFAGRFNWRIEDKTSKLLRQAVKEELPLLLSRQRVRQELIKILQEHHSKRIFGLLKKYDAAKFIYPRLKWTPKVGKVKTVDDKILMLALSMGGGGAEFLQHLHLEHADYKKIFDIWKLHFERKAPAKPISAAAKKLLKLFNPKLATCALKPCFITAADAQAAGFSGVAIGKIINQFAALQWRGKIKTRRGALKLLNGVKYEITKRTK